MMSAAKKGGLGRGLNALFEDEEAPAFAAPAAQNPAQAPVAAEDPSAPRKTLPVSALRPSKFQPRQSFDDATIKELSESIATHGILQPLLVRPLKATPGAYEIIGGERRWRAAQKAQLHNVPVIIRDLDDEAAMEIALIENLQREDLNALDEAEAYQRLMEEFAHTQEKLASVVGKSRSHVANMVRLLTLPASVRRLLRDGKLTAGHARALITAKDPETLAAQVVARGLSVRDTEKLAALSDSKTPKLPKNPVLSKDIDTLNLEKDMSAQLLMKVSIDLDKKGEDFAESGTLSVKFKNMDQLDVLIKLLQQKV